MRTPKHILVDIEKRKCENAFRTLSTNFSIDFSSNDFLGLAKNQDVLNLVKERLLTTQQIGATGSRLLSGNSNYIIQLENKLASIFKSEDSLLFSSGYNANLALLSSLAKKGDTIIYDEKAHASIKDGARLSLAKRFSFKHNDAVNLDYKLQKCEGEKYVIVESIYSMDGDFCLLGEIISVCKKHKAFLIVDEAHSTGIYGDKCSGWVAEKGYENDVFARIFTFGKAMGTSGAAIALSKQFKDYLVNFSRPFIYTTGLNYLNLISIEASFDYLMKNENLKTKLFDNIKFFKELVQTGSDTAIQPIYISGSDKIKALSTKLQQQELDVRPILNPTVPKGQERIRVCLHSFNTKEEIKLLAKSFNSII